MFNQLIADAIALYNWMFRSGSLVTPEILAQFQSMLAGRGAITVADGKIVFAGAEIVPYASRIQFTGEKSATVHLNMNESLDVKIKRGRLVVQSNKA